MPVCIGILRSLRFSPSFCLVLSQVSCHFIFMFSSCLRSLSASLPFSLPLLCHIYHGSLLWRPGAEVLKPGRCISQLSKSCTQPEQLIKRGWQDNGCGGTCCCRLSYVALELFLCPLAHTHTHTEHRQWQLRFCRRFWWRLQAGSSACYPLCSTRC